MYAGLSVSVSIALAIGALFLVATPLHRILRFQQAKLLGPAAQGHACLALFVGWARAGALFAISCVFKPPYPILSRDQSLLSFVWNKSHAFGGGGGMEARRAAGEWKKTTNVQSWLLDTLQDQMIRYTSICRFVSARDDHAPRNHRPLGERRDST